MRVARPKWTPQTEEQRRAIADVERAAKRADEVTAAADAVLWEKVRKAHGLDVPPAHLAEKAKRARSTVYRHLDDERTEVAE